MHDRRAGVALVVGGLGSNRVAEDGSDTGPKMYSDSATAALTLAAGHGQHDAMIGLAQGRIRCSG